MMEEYSEICAKWWADRLETTEKRKEFELALAPKIRDNMTILVEYNIEYSLYQALSDVGEEPVGAAFNAMGIFPFKTWMEILRGVVRVKIGNYGEITTLFPPITASTGNISNKNVS